MTSKQGTPPASILILDTDRDMGELFRRALEHHRINRCFLAFDESEALDLLQSFPVHLVLVDIAILSRHRFRLLREIITRSPDTVILTDGPIHQVRLLRDAVTLGAHGYLVKPISVEACRTIVGAFLTGSATLSSQGDSSVIS